MDMDKIDSITTNDGNQVAGDAARETIIIGSGPAGLAAAL